MARRDGKRDPAGNGENEQRLRQKLLETLGEGVFGIDAGGNYTFLNPAACQLLGFTAEEEALGRNSHDLSHHTHRDGSHFNSVHCPIYNVLETGSTLRSWEDFFWNQEGFGFPVLINAAPMFDDVGTVCGAVVSFQDISERKRIQERMKQSEQELAEAQRIAHLGSWVSDLVAGEIRWSDEVYRIFGMDQNEWGGTESAFMEAVHPEDRARVRGAIDNALRPDGPRYDIEHRIQRPDGSVRIVYQKGRVDFDDDGRPLRMVGVVHDITEQREAENLLQYLSYHDVLTELPNRTLFRHRVERARSELEHFAVFYLGLDRFKGINEGMGHDVGDRLLQQVARRIEEKLRPGDPLARVGGDEFAVLLRGIEGDEAVATEVERLLAPLRELYPVDEEEFYVPASAGVALFPSDGTAADELLNRAEAAMHQAKQNGGNGYHFCSTVMNDRARTRVTLTSRLRRAVNDGEGFFLDYQPRVRCGSGAVVGVEALLRWRDPEGMVHSPTTFIPVLEQTGLINELGAWIVEEACGQCRSWRDAGLPPVQMAVNLAAPQFRDAGLPAAIERVLSKTGLPPEGLELEVTESMLMSDIPSVTRTLGEFRDMGVRVALDDFGTGYSSLAYLRQFPLDILKIDRSFVNDIQAGNGGVAIIRTILSLAENLQLETVAEGVETAAQHEFLDKEGCGSIQGFLFARPDTPEACAELIARRHLVGVGAAP
ncbi:MAG: EAL domain-containing protein [Pseudomonadota bacterium]